MPGVFQFSQTAANNADAVPSISWAEGQAPSSLNDSARAEMAAVACYRDDISGSILTTGTSTAFIVSSNQGFDKLTNFDKKTIAFTVHATNGPGPVSMTVDGFPNLPLRSSPNTELPSGVLVQGSSYVALYNNTDGALYLQGFYGNLGIPLGAMIDYIGSTSPFSNYAIPLGQALSRTTFASLFALIGTTYGAGDDSTTFNLPNLSGRVVAMLDDTGGILSTFGMTPNGNTLGAVGGAQGVDIAQSQLPNILLSISGTASGSISGFAQANEISVNPSGAALATTPSGGTAQNLPVTGTFSGSVAGATASINGGVTQNALNVLQPTMALNKLLRIA
jgi:microcystin-dependent protein